MRWVIIACIVVSAVFIILFLQTRDTWVATNAAGVVSLAYLVGLVYRAVRPPVSRKARGWTIGIVSVVLIAVGMHWRTMFLQTHFQSHALHTVRKIIFHGVMPSEGLCPRALEAFAEFHQQPEPKTMSLGEIFRKHNPPLEPGSSLLDTLYQADRGDRVYLASISDTSVVLIGQSTFVEGEDPSFKNFDGRIGMVQQRLRLTTKGVHFEIQN